MRFKNFPPICWLPLVWSYDLSQGIENFFLRALIPGRFWANRVCYSEYHLAILLEIRLSCLNRLWSGLAMSMQLSMIRSELFICDVCSIWRHVPCRYDFEYMSCCFVTEHNQFSYITWSCASILFPSVKCKILRLTSISLKRILYFSQL